MLGIYGLPNETESETVEFGHAIEAGFCGVMTAAVDTYANMDVVNIRMGQFIERMATREYVGADISANAEENYLRMEACQCLQWT